MNNFYTLTVYEKGAEVIRMIHTLLGEKKFRAGMDLYFQRFDGMAVTCDDFVNAMADASGIDLTLFKRWYSQSGTPKLVVTESFDTTSGVFTLTVSQQHQATTEQPEKLALHIPIGIELLNQNGELESHLLQLTDEQKTWHFEHFQHKPTVAFLTNFTAPVKVDYQQSDSELEQIMVNGQDQFCRWDAGQKLFTAYLFKLMTSAEFELPVRVIDVCRDILTADIDPALIAEQLTLPSFDEIADNVDEVDPARILSALDKLKSFIASHLTAEFKQCYQRMKTQAVAGQKGTAARALANCCLTYLALTEQGSSVVKTHFDDSTCMTDSLAALTIAAKQQLADFTSMSDTFEHQWYDTTLVMDKWFTVRAVEDNENMFSLLSALLSHPLFNIENPNRARALIGAFMMHNPKYFHCQTGQGYQFLGQQIKKLNEINPQVAARLITPLLAFKRYEPLRKEKIKQQLVELSALPNLSKDLQEKISAALSS